MLDFEVKRCTRHCAKTDREFLAGESFFSTLVADGADVVRYDYGLDAWDGPPEGSLGWWKSVMPDHNAKKLHWAPNDVMLHYFHETEGRQEKQDIRYVLALLMIRRRIVRIDATESNQDGNEVLSLYCPRNEKRYQVPVMTPSKERIGQIQEELAQLLFAKAA